MQGIHLMTIFLIVVIKKRKENEFLFDKIWLDTLHVIVLNTFILIVKTSKIQKAFILEIAVFFQGHRFLRKFTSRFEQLYLSVRLDSATRQLIVYSFWHCSSKNCFHKWSKLILCISQRICSLKRLPESDQQH